MLRRRGFSSKRGENGFARRSAQARKICFAGSAMLLPVVEAVSVEVGEESNEGEMQGEGSL
jgi:hypothetical protein